MQNLHEPAWWWPHHISDFISCHGYKSSVLPYLVDENLCTSRAHEQHGPSQSVTVPVELLCAHGVEEVIEDSAHVAVHPLQWHIKTQPGHLVHEGLQTTDIWREEGKSVIKKKTGTEKSTGNHNLRHHFWTMQAFSTLRLKSADASLRTSWAEEQCDRGLSEGVGWSKTESDSLNSGWKKILKMAVNAAMSPPLSSDWMKICHLST